MEFHRRYYGYIITGFLLFGYIGSRAIFVLLVVVLLSSTAFLAEKWHRAQWLLALSAFFAAASAPTYAVATNIDTPSSHYTLFEWRKNTSTYRGLAMGPDGIQSGIDVQQPYKPIFWYTQQLASLVDHTPKRSDILMLGGGTFTLPQQIAVKYPKSSVDVVEIDPKLVDIARKYFFYRDPKNVNLIFEDARTYSNRANKQYDIIIVDTYGNTDIPFTFMTSEYSNAIANILKPGGVVMANMIAGRQGDCQKLLSALEAPYRYNFQYRGIRSDTNITSAYLPHNIVGVYSDIPLHYEYFEDADTPRIDPYTDDFTPAERLRQNCLT